MVEGDGGGKGWCEWKRRVTVRGEEERREKQVWRKVWKHEVQ